MSAVASPNARTKNSLSKSHAQFWFFSLEFRKSFSFMYMKVLNSNCNAIITVYTMTSERRFASTSWRLVWRIINRKTRKHPAILKYWNGIVKQPSQNYHFVQKNIYDRKRNFQNTVVKSAIYIRSKSIYCCCFSSTFALRSWTNELFKSRVRNAEISELDFAQWLAKKTYIFECTTDEFSFRLLDKIHLNWI